jgi:xanthine dehydrogenase accessory factor
MDRRNSSASLKDLRILVIGAGDLATGTAHRLFRSGFRIMMTEISRPLAVRRTVSFSEAAYDGVQVVEEVRAERIYSPEEADRVWAAGSLPLLISEDPDLGALAFDVVVEATLRKHNTGLSREDASLVIGLGPGFAAGEDVHAVVETNRGHNLGRVIYEGSAEANTGIPGNIAGYTWERVLRSPAEGVFEADVNFGDTVAQGQVVARVAGLPVVAGVGGIVRGLIRPGIDVERDAKVGDIDPRGEIGYLYSISDKARAIAGSVLEAVLHRFNC